MFSCESFNIRLGRMGTWRHPPIVMRLLTILTSQTSSIFFLSYFAFHILSLWNLAASHWAMLITWLYLAHVLFGGDPFNYHVAMTPENDTGKHDSMNMHCDIFASLKFAKLLAWSFLFQRLAKSSGPSDKKAMLERMTNCNVEEWWRMMKSADEQCI